MVEEVTMTQTGSQRAALVALLRHAKRLGLAQSEIRARLDRGETPATVLASSGEDGLFPPDNEPALAEAAELIDKWEKAGQRMIASLEPDYPQQLASAYDYPFVLFYAGLLRDDTRSIAIVGSRSPSPRGLEFADALSAMAARSGITVVSGLARGIDRAAHEAALRAGGRTVAVIGTGLGRYYPPEHASLQDRIAREGLVVSQFLPEAPPSRSSFPMRNATMSAYSGLTVIVEAGEKSGTRLQAAAAVRHGRPLILTEPVATTTSWGREYVDQGYDATVVTGPKEALTTAESMLARTSQLDQWADRLASAG
jgi:DNA processing protein